MVTKMLTRLPATVLVFLFIGGRAPTQEHAPTVDVCRADRAVWRESSERLDYSQQELRHEREGTTNKNNIGQLPYKELLSRQVEMGTCMMVDTPDSEAYSDVVGFYQQVEGDRYHHFVERHHMMSQFLDEDAAGLR